MYLFCLTSKFIKLFLRKDFLGFSIIHIRITDLFITVNFDWITGINISKKNTTDVSISSDSLNYIFKHQWGCGSLMVNGRGDYKNEYTKWLFNRMFVLGLVNSAGQTLLPRTFKKIIRELLKKISGGSLSLHEIEPSFLEKNKKINKKNKLNLNL